MKVVEELKMKLENASFEEIKALQQSEDPIYWFLLLAEYPEFAPDSSWWFALRNRCDLPWSKLLAAQPQFEEHCHWESVSRLELMILAFKAPSLFQRHFPQGRAHDLYAFLTPLEKAHLLIEVPEYADQVNWDELDAEFSIGNWFSLLSFQPQFEIYFDWSKVEKQPNHYWDMLLKKQPQFAIHCDLERLYPNQRRKLIKSLLVAGKDIAPWNKQTLLTFLSSRKWDMEYALEERFNHEWGKRKYASAVSEAEQWRKYFLEEDKLDKIPYGFDANSLFKRRFKLEMRRVRISANIDVARCWVRLLKHRPEYVGFCPWHFFQGDRIWQTLQDEEFLKAIKRTPLQVAGKMNLNAMSSADWDEVVKIVPELASRRPKNDYVCIVE